MKSMFTENEQYGEFANKFDLEIGEAIRPIIQKYVDMDFSVRHIQIILAHAAFEAGLLAILDKDVRPDKE